jgi:hypothetical protein
MLRTRSHWLEEKPPTHGRYATTTPSTITVSATRDPRSTEQPFVNEWAGSATERGEPGLRYTLPYDLLLIDC